MNRAIAILLMLTLSCQCLVKLGIVAWYQVNKDYVAKTLCENKDKPKMKCCGKCYLRKQLAKANDSNKQSKQQPDKTEKYEVINFVVPQKIMVERVFFSNAHNYNPSSTNFLLSELVVPIFHPPSVTC